METTPELKPDNKIGNINVEEEMRSSYIDYAMSVIVGRALPDARDGLKPVHRRVLFAMRELGNYHNKPYKKSARIVGDVIGKYHPHGDQAVYDTIVRMAQDFSLRYLMVDGQGNFGSIDGDPPAAMRYTEVRMSRLAEELLADIEKETVDFGPNYDGQLMQPLVLPSKFPNLLLNGSTGIAVGMATNIPPHNICELIDALVVLIDNPEVSVDELMKHVKGPDFPTGGIICGTVPISNMYKTGRGQLKVRGRATIEEVKQGKETIIITEIPYTVNKTSLVENIAHLIQEKTLEGISDLRDESNKDGIRIVIELKRGTIPKVILNNIYKHTQLETTFGAIMLAIDNGKPKVMNLKELMQCFTKHRFEVITKRTKFELAKAEARAHILEGLKIALDNLEAIVKTIRQAGSRDEARTNLMNKFKLSEVQANAILDMRLYQLTGLERKKIDEEYLEVIKYISYLRDLLSLDSKIYGVIKTELLELKKLYGDMRRTDIAPDEGEIDIQDLVADRGCIITISHSGYIKRVPIDTYKAQRRGGKGVSGMDVKEEDFVENLFVASTHDYILFFTAAGRVYWEKVYEIPEAGRTSRGKAIVNLLNIQSDERVSAMIRVREFSESKFLVMATQKGVIKKTSLAEFSNPRSGGIIAINIDEGDYLIQVKMTNGNDEVVLATRNGLSIRFSEKKLRDQGRATRGVRGITLRENDLVETLEIVNLTSTFLVCTENGYGKRTSFDEYRSQGRGGKGVIAIRTSDRNGMVVGARAVQEADSLMLITEKGKMIRMAVSDVRVIGRATQGVRLINLDEGDKLVSATTFEPEDKEIPDQPTET
ncbi:MAG: DNA gyrase subunit A [Kiritimatiellae bacterium]|nr:DNA gyrase subunit A [Kiritimatiellia bacterium]MDD5522346.1 DNA gyrase subunit A [Kiritimatiellia bacterium]